MMPKASGPSANESNPKPQTAMKDPGIRASDWGAGKCGDIDSLNKVPN